MAMRHRSFAALILTHGRPDRVHTVATLRRAGYTGRIVIVIDNEDKAADAYRKEFGDAVVMFDKSAVAAATDEGNNFGDRRTILYARNASFEIARDLGIDRFVQLDDDYTDFYHMAGEFGRFIHRRRVRDMDAVFAAMVEFLDASGALSVAFDFIGGKTSGAMKLRRKCMNSFFCSTDRPFRFVGTMNEDVNTYTTLGSRGALFFTAWQLSLIQKATQTNTYVKSFYTVMMQPSSVRVSVLPTTNPRIHHVIDWRRTVPLILPGSARKP